jgi:molybdenum cofactor cytidylyltransferase
MYRAIVLAAGESRRMGAPKLLLPLRGGSILRTVLDSVRRCRVGEILLVTGANREAIENEARGPSIRFVFNPSFAEGMLSSVVAAFGALPPDTDAALVFLGDQPSIDPSVVDELLDAHARTGRGLVVPTFEGRRGHPLLIDAKYRDAVLALDRAIGLRGLLRDHPDDVLEVSVAFPGILRDIDTPEDYRGELRREG